MKKLLAIMLALIMVLVLVPALALDWDIGNGDITVNAGSGGQTVTQGPQVNVSDSAPVITGSSTDNTLTINAEKGQTASVTLSDVNIDVSGKRKAAVSTTGEGDVSIELDGENTLKSGKTHAGLEKNNGGSLTIAGENKNGKLTAEGGNYGAGIGGGHNKDGSNITITGGEVTATGGNGGAGIGGGMIGNGSNITISGGEVKAAGGSSGAGIGGGGEGDGSKITISGGEVTATGGDQGAGIGGGEGGSGSNITTSGGEVKATGGYLGAGIGGGIWGNGSNITISGGEVKAAGGSSGAGIGGGYSGYGENITVSGDAKLKVRGGDVGDGDEGAGAGIGNGGDRKNEIPVNGEEVEPDTSGLTTNGKIEYYAPGADMEHGKPIRTLPPQEKPIDPGAERGAAAPLYRVTDRDGRDIAYMAEQKGGVLTVTVDEDFAVLTASLSGMTALRAQGVEKIIFVTNGAKTAVKLSAIISKLTASGVFRLTHDGKAATFTIG